MRMRAGLVLALLTLSLGSAVAAAQQDSSQPPPASQPAPKDPKDKDKGKTPPADSAPASGQSSDSLPATPSTGKKPSTADDNPFPEDISRKAAAEAAKSTATGTPDVPPAKPQGSSSRDGLDKLGLDDESRRQLKLESPDGTTDVYNPKRASEDLRVGQFYMKTGDFKGAYLRFKDAIEYDQENPDAVFWLAEAARKTNRPEEATQNYQLYLAAVPDGVNAKMAKRALGELSSVKKP